MRIFSLGDNAITVEFGNEVSHELNLRAIALSEHFESNPFHGFVETVPAYSSATIFFEPNTVRDANKEFRSAFEAVRSKVERAIVQIQPCDRSQPTPAEIPVIFDHNASLDLEELSRFAGLDVSEVVTVYLERIYRVFMIGFLPGFAYLGEVDDRIAMPRKQTPRVTVPAGSVGIAGRQTGIYPFETPGGWQIIGRTKMRMFEPESEPTCPLRPGDLVKFVRA